MNMHNCTCINTSYHLHYIVELLNMFMNIIKLINPTWFSSQNIQWKARNTTPNVIDGRDVELEHDERTEVADYVLSRPDVLHFVHVQAKHCIFASVLNYIGLHWFTCGCNPRQLHGWTSHLWSNQVSGRIWKSWKNSCSKKRKWAKWPPATYHSQEL